ncbi:tautomerase family protein [Jatrophihabitans endophyticus]|uniref:tautomerase family protein n=1 Tax=Jatrophihabitans endophyticus TaxID=1206085 RepID=UPI0019DFBF1A|nr:tautomerase family protein [Jatrophihabitans endophyticus]MBE7189821.1 4-oxalocrotonate tautomerase [Jatrophihabitans endophyticus]
MPTYVVYAAAPAIPDAARADLAVAITEIHARLTGAPKSFVQTIFRELAAGAHFIGGRPTDPRGVWVHGHIRAGRSPEVRSAIALEISDALQDIAGTPRGHVWVYISELDDSDMIEFGEVLPPPGAELEWIQALPPETRDRLVELN